MRAEQFPSRWQNRSAISCGLPASLQASKELYSNETSLRGYGFVRFSGHQIGSVLNHKIHTAGDRRETVKIPFGIELQVGQELIEQAGLVRILIREGQ